MIKKIVLGIIIFFALSAVVIYIWPETSYTPYVVSDDYQAQVDEFYVPDMPADWVWNTFVAKDGTTLRWGETGNAQASLATLIWVPGYTATLNMYGEHFDDLARNGIHVVGIDLRGQGGSQRHRETQPEKMWVEDFSVYSEDLAAFIQSLEISDTQPKILAGVSFGGHVSTRAMGDHAIDIDGLYLVAPALKPRSDPYTFEQAKRLMNVSRFMGKSQNYVFGQDNWKPDGTDTTQPTRCSSHPPRLYYRDVIFTRMPEQRVGGVTNQWGAEFFESSEYILSEGYLEALDLPVTLISAETDDFVDTSINRDVCANRFSDCKDVFLPGTGHCIPQENDEVLLKLYEEIFSLVDRVKRLG